MKETLTTIITSLVEFPEQVSITEKEEENILTFEVKVAPTDMGKVIGREGKMATAIRTVMKALGAKEAKKIMIEFVRIGKYMEEYLEIGQIVNTNGLKGLLKIKPFTDDITRFEDLEVIYIQKGQELIAKNIEDVKYVKNMVLLKLEGIDDINEAEKYRNLYIKINKKDVKELPEGEYLIADMLKCDVYTDENELLGEMVDVFNTGSNDVYVVKTEAGKEILLPAIKEVVKKIDIQNNKIVVKLMDGLI